MFAGSPFGAGWFAEPLIAAFARARQGIGGGGISDEEYERLLRRLGATTAADLEEDDALVAMRMLGLV